VRAEDRRAADASLRALTERQASHAQDFAHFAALVERDLAAAVGRAQEAHAATSAPRLLARLKQEVAAAVAGAEAAQGLALQRQEQQLRALKATLQGAPDATQVPLLHLCLRFHRRLLQRGRFSPGVFFSCGEDL
jgi:hypothetical protein